MFIGKSCFKLLGALDESHWACFVKTSSADWQAAFPGFYGQILPLTHGRAGLSGPGSFELSLMIGRKCLPESLKNRPEAF